MRSNFNKKPTAEASQPQSLHDVAIDVSELSDSTQIESKLTSAVIPYQEIPSHEVIPKETVENDIESTNFWDIFKNISSLSIPMALSFTFSIEIFIITILRNYLSDDENELAATTLITLLINTLAIIGMSPLFAMSMVASKQIGDLTISEDASEDENILQQKRDSIAGINVNGLVLSSILSGPVILGLLYSKPLLTNVFGQDEKVAELSQNFLRAYSPAIPALLTRISTEQMIFSFGRARAAMILGLINLGIGTGIFISLWKVRFTQVRLGGYSHWLCC